MKNEPLFFYEELLLLALQDEKGKLFFGALALPAIAGGIVAELLFRRKIELNTVRRKQYVRLLDASPMGDSVLDSVLDRINSAGRPATIQVWVGRIARFKRLMHQVAGQLCDKGLLRMESRQVLLFFKQRLYPERDPRPEREMIERMRSAIFTRAGEVDARTTVLVSLAKGANFLGYVFDKRKLKERKARIEQIVNGEACGAATKEAIQAMQAAVMAAVIIPSVVASTSH